jgi:hypothetical protein
MADEEALNPADPVDARLLDMKAAFERRPDRAEIEQRIQRDQGLGRDDKNDAEIARMKAAYESARDGATAPTASSDSGGPGPGYNEAKEQFRQDLGVEGGPGFEVTVQNFHSWAADTFSSPEDFHRLAVAAEEALGVKEAARLAVQLAEAHARRKSRR